MDGFCTKATVDIQSLIHRSVSNGRLRTFQPSSYPITHGVTNRQACVNGQQSKFLIAALLAQKRVINLAVVLAGGIRQIALVRLFFQILRVFLFTQKVCIQV
jgi:hypothetical protein